jgi:transposase InsO family protein
MIGLLCFVLASPFKSKLRLEAENAVLRHQLIVLRRKMPGRPWLTNNDRRFFLQMYRWFPSILKVVRIIQPETLVRWLSGRLSLFLALEVIETGRAAADRDGIPRADPADEHREPILGGAAHPRRTTQARPCRRSIKRRQIHGQATWVAKPGMVFLHNHAPDIAAMDLFVVPTIGFKLLYAFVIVRLNRTDLVCINVTTNPNAEWIARQITEAFPWNEAPRYVIRDRDRIYGAVVTRRLRAMGIRDKPIAPASPWQNGFAERLIGSIRRECLDHIIVLGEEHLSRILTHRSLNKDALVSRPVPRSGVISSHAIITTTFGFRFRYTQEPGRGLVRLRFDQPPEASGTDPVWIESGHHCNLGPLSLRAEPEMFRRTFATIAALNARAFCLG